MKVMPEDTTIITTAWTAWKIVFTPVRKVHFAIHSISAPELLTAVAAGMKTLEAMLTSWILAMKWKTCVVHGMQYA